MTTEDFDLGKESRVRDADSNHFQRFFFFLCHIQAREKLFFLAVEQVN
jgi:hypothetical protein